MADLLRFGVSMEKELLAEFDGMIAKKGYANRSDAIRSLIRSQLLEARAEHSPDIDVIGTLTLVYDHTTGDLPNRLTDIQHRSHRSIVSTLHVHFDPHNCLEVLVVRGKQKEVRAISDSLIGTRGVHQGKLVINAGMKTGMHRPAAQGKKPRAH
jgi:CopG family nickel-responsive transcriptional regulator